MSYRIGTWSLCAGISVWLVSAVIGHAQDVSPLKQRLLQEAPQAWRNYEEFCQTLQGSSSAERRELTGSDKDKVSRRVVGHWKQCPGHRLTQQEIFERDSYRGAVAVYNPQYKFSLTRDSDQKPWVIREIIRRSPDAALPEAEPPLGLVFGEPVQYLPLVFDSPGFKVVNVTAEPNTGEELVRMTFTYSPKDKTQNPRSGWLVLDAKHDWIIRAGEIEITWDSHTKIRQTFDHEYKEGSDHHPVSTKASLRSTATQNGRVVHEHELRGTLDLHEQKWVPENEFTLSAYGLPEPPWLRPKKSPWYVWAGLAGILCLIAAAVLRLIKRRSFRVDQTMGG